MPLNQLGFEVVDDSLFRQLFPTRQRASLSIAAESRVREHYRNFGVELPPKMPKTVQHDWKLPKLQGNTLEEHFENIAKQFAGPYDRRARQLIAQDLPEMPQVSEIVKISGWVMYKDGVATPVPHPLEDTFVLDCETLVIRGGFPVIATAVSRLAWYIWLDPALVDVDVKYQQRLYPLGTGKFIIGHNVTYDFQRGIESHHLQMKSGERNYFFDTMSAHIVLNGYGGQQRWADKVDYAPAWAETGTSNSLVKCYNFHCWPDTPLTEQDKELRDIFVKCDLPVIRARFDELIQYALLDVKYTWELFAHIYPKFRQKRPSWTSLAGGILQSAHNLPVVDNWFEWIDTCEEKLSEYEEKISQSGLAIAENLLNKFKSWLNSEFPDDECLGWETHNQMLDNFVKGNGYHYEATDPTWWGMMADPWLGAGVLDWDVNPRAKKHRGCPEWYRKLMVKKKSMGRASRELHQFLKLAWEDKPILWKGPALKWQWQDDTGKWNSIYKPGTDEKAEVLFSKDLKDYFEQGNITVKSEGGEETLNLCMAVTYWVSTRKRVMNQIVYPDKSGGSDAVNVIVPDLLPWGTISGRGVSPLWLTVTDVKPKNRNRLGAELKSRIQAPKGYKFLQADFSGQELRIGGVYADSIAAREYHDDPNQLGYVGSCVMTHGIYAGNKEEGTDPHTMAAKQVGISRDDAKTAGYATLYGAAGETISKSFVAGMMRSNPDLDRQIVKSMARKKADEFLFYKKGRLVKGTDIYQGGTDSHCFTVLRLLASKPYPKTPLLGNQLTAPMCSANCGKDYAPGRTNWGIQSTARDQADCVAVAFHWLCQQHRVDARIIFLYHDEFLVLCREEHAEVASWLLNVCHVWVWAFTNEKMGIYDLCTVGMFFDDVIVQDVFRKEAKLSTNTPTNPNEQVPDGRVLLQWDMPRLNEQAIALCPGLYNYSPEKLNVDKLKEMLNS